MCLEQIQKMFRLQCVGPRTVKGSFFVFLFLFDKSELSQNQTLEFLGVHLRKENDNKPDD